MPPILNCHRRFSTVSIKKGWVQSIRKHKNVAFLQIHNGHFSDQFVLDDPTTLTKDVTIGAAVQIDCRMVDSELHASKIKVLGESPSLTYPLQKKYHTNDFLRTIPHLRCRTNQFRHLLQVRSVLQKAFSDFFSNEDFYFIHAPLLTVSDCEGGSAMFTIRPNLFGEREVFLSVSSQLHLEAAALGSLSNVWTLGPLLRAERSDTSRHLCEFWMLEAEISFITNIDELLVLIERAIKFVIKSVLESKTLLDENKRNHLLFLYSGHFKKVSYSEALSLLSEQAKDPLPWGQKLTFEDESAVLAYLMEKDPKTIGVFITHYPETGKPFYMKRVDRVVENFDLIVKEIGELAGGSLREESEHKVLQNIKALNLKQEPLNWYLDTRRFGTVPHGGFGLGFDRLVQWLLKIPNIRDAVFLPRAPGPIHS